MFDDHDRCRLRFSKFRPAVVVRRQPLNERDDTGKWKNDSTGFPVAPALSALTRVPW
jgi:hypothetical protein